MNVTALPVAVIGAGPVGLAAAAQLVQRGEAVRVFEAGSSVGASVLAWGHVRLFSPWQYVVDAAARTLLVAHGWTMPDAEAYPTGAELVRDYLAPLAALPEMARVIKLNAHVTAVARDGLDKMKTVGREQAPFVLRVTSADGREEAVLARAVIDASGTYTMPNPLGANGLPAIGERAAADHTTYGVPDVLDAQRSRYAGKRVLVVGSGHSAFNALLDLIQLASQEPETSITWAIRRADAHQLYGGGAADALPARGLLGARLRDLVARSEVQLVTNFAVTAVQTTPAGLVVASNNRELPPVDEIIVTTGFRPDRSLLGELRLALDSTVESPLALAPLIDPNVHSCGTVPPHGVDELSHPEPGLYIVGMKSYGRAPTFLMLTGYEQVRSVVAALAGDWAAARDVQLVLPETGVCSTDLGGSCCTPSNAVLHNDVRIDLVPLVATSTKGTINLIPLTVATAAACCAPTVQASCCEPDEKADCCGADGSACGCA